MEQNFILNKAQVDTMGVTCTYKVVEQKEDGTEQTFVYTKKDNRPPHEDLLEQMDNFGGIAKELLGTDRKVIVNRLALSGKDTKKAVVLSGEIIPRVKFSTGKINYAGDSELAVRLTAIVGLFEYELNKYLFEDKVAKECVLGE